MRNPRPWPGGLVNAPNKIPAGYDVAAASMGVAQAGERRWRNFGRADRRDQVQLAGLAGMAENCGFCGDWGDVVARLPSHGGQEALRSQRLGPISRLMPDLARSCGPRSIRRGALPPFRPAPGATTVAAESRQRGEFRPSSALQSCLMLRSGRSLPQRIYGSGSGRFTPRPQYGVGGAGRSGARIGSASDGNGALRAEISMGLHGRQAPFIERLAASYGLVSAAVNAAVQASVDNCR